MALSRVKSWIAGEVLYASDLNGEFNNILNNALALISPLTGNLDVNSNQLLNARFEVRTATQFAAIAGRTYWQSTENALHIDTGTLVGTVNGIAKTPALLDMRAGALVGLVNPTSVEGATTYARITLGSDLILTQSTSTLSVALGGASILKVQVFS